MLCFERKYRNEKHILCKMWKNNKYQFSNIVHINSELVITPWPSHHPFSFQCKRSNISISQCTNKKVCHKIKESCFSLSPVYSFVAAQHKNILQHTSSVLRFSILYLLPGQNKNSHTKKNQPKISEQMSHKHCILCDTFWLIWTNNINLHWIQFDWMSTMFDAVR